MKAKSLILFPLWNGFPEKGTVPLSDAIVLDKCPEELLNTDIGTLPQGSESFIYRSPFGHRGVLLPPKDQKEAYGRLIASELHALQPTKKPSPRDQANWALIMSIPPDLSVVLRWVL